MEALLRDLRYSARSLIKAPGFLAIAVLILGLGIGANSTMFTLVSALLLEEPPLVSEPDRLVRINGTDERSRSRPLSYPDYVSIRDRNQVFSGVAAYDEFAIPVMMNAGETLAQADAGLVSANYFDVLGVAPAVGRSFNREDGREGAAPAVMIDEGFWQRQLGGDPDVIGGVIRLNDMSFTVVGVVPAAFRGIGPTETPPDIWMPAVNVLRFFPELETFIRRVPNQRTTWLQSLGRLAPGSTLEAAQANLDVIAGQLTLEFPDSNEGEGLALADDFRHRPAVKDRLVSLMRVLTGVAAAVLLIACANIAILLLARGSARERELGVRRAIGAGRARIMGAQLTESLLIALAGGALGLLIATWTADLAAALLPFTFSVDFSPDVRVLGFTLAVALVVTLLAGTLPAWLASRSDIAAVMKSGGRTAGERSRLRSGLVVAQVALAIVLVTGAGLFLRSLWSANSVERGFEAENRVAVMVNLMNRGYGEEEGRAFVRTALERIAAVPGIEAATTALVLPTSGAAWTGDFTADGATPPEGDDGFQTAFNTVGPGYFRLMGIPLLAGREFTESDDAAAPVRVVLNQAAAEMVWPGQSPIGKIIQRDELEATVVGLASNANYFDLGEEPQPQVYFAELQRYRPRVNFIARTAAKPGAEPRLMAEAIHELDAALPILRTVTMEEIVARSVGQQRVMAALVGTFGFLALALAAVGLYGVLSYLVVQRTREVGIRMALGAHPGDVAARVLRRGLALAGAGIVIGAAAAWASARLISGLLFGVTANDPLTFLAVPFVLAGVAALASLVPARRAAAIDPMEALRHE